MRYAAVAFYGKTYLADLMMSSNCINAAIDRVRAMDEIGGIVIASEGPGKDTSPLSQGFKQRFRNDRPA